ncbi:hypothetical protein Q9966_004161 [Columba livia]|nr:hypothetical protein Q9966_004161 [Columba livia]
MASGYAHAMERQALLPARLDGPAGLDNLQAKKNFSVSHLLDLEEAGDMVAAQADEGSGEPGRNLLESPGLTSGSDTPQQDTDGQRAADVRWLPWDEQGKPVSLIPRAVVSILTSLAGNWRVLSSLQRVSLETISIVVQFLLKTWLFIAAIRRHHKALVLSRIARDQVTVFPFRKHTRSLQRGTHPEQTPGRFPDSEVYFSGALSKPE